nr:platelet glycoprotein Ib alpha chain-like [Ipomoea batatas]
MLICDLVCRAEMKKTTAAHKKSKEVDTATEMPEQQKTKGTKSGAKRKAPKQDLPKHQKTKKPRKTPEKGKVIPRFEREEERVHERIDENVQAELSDESLKKVTSVLRKMADTVVEFGEVMAEIGNSRTGGGIIKRTFENIAKMINGVSSSQPPQQQSLLDDDDIFNQPSFLDAVSALEQAFLQTRKNYAAQPEQPTTSQSPHHIQTPSFDLGVPSPQPAAMEQPQNKIDSSELRNIARDLDEDSEKTISDEQQLDTTPEDNTMKQLFDSEELFEYVGYYLNRETF